MSTAADTPMMRQYLELKAQVPDAILLYRMGDFYELFLDDARVGAEIMELTLTSRNKNDPDPVPMCGVPHHALEGYLGKLLEAGKKVAIAEQTEDPAVARKLGRTVVKRELVRVVSPGLPLDADGLEAREPCYLAAASGTGPVGVAFLDISTGDLRVTELPDIEAAGAELARLEARELLLDPDVAEALPPGLARLPRTVAEPAWFDVAAARQTLCQALGVADLSGFGAEGLGPGLGAAGALVSYARDTAKVDLHHLRALRPYSVGGHMVLDEATRRNLEITRPLRGSGRKGTLLGLLDRSATPMGGRLLRDWLGFPLVEVAGIQRRLDAVEALLDGALRQGTRDRLKAVADLERLAGKTAQGTANARDLVALAGSLDALPEVVALLDGVPALSQELPRDLLTDVAKDIEHWLIDEPPIGITEGGLMRRGVHEWLDQLTDMAREGKGAIAKMETRERERTGINSLKIKHNRVFGYFIEITQANLDRVPADWFRKQTLANCERFITPELKEFEENVLGADDKRRALEYELFCELRTRVAAHVGRLQALARAVAWLDAVGALAEVAVFQRYVRPVVDNSGDLEIIGGRHPVVESMGLDERFVPNDIVLDADQRLVILTGPNMAGKSTVMRQAAIIALMAQIGSFVPAERARVGLCDRVVVRVGASDDLAHGRSTFMVEMAETALILNQATSRSLILLDEIGRGTSTYDGLAIAWAVAEDAHDRLRARTIFATHYHELISLGHELPRAVNRHIAVSDLGEQIVFLRALREGGASKSYGIQCARLAGLPGHVIERARALLTDLERKPRATAPTRQLSLFGGPPGPPAAPPPDPTPRPDPVRDALAALDPDALSPRDAPAALARLRALLGEP